ncbi:albusnodin/ikarugamycin family macrolactam cyclase [Actinophytocola sp.]|uniref:albusnodin/ikarugamycin family macrolactam cyclase n=1 Tax=Actinophytocola sp. TaxID=1872138 RepID=UPI00389B251E
MGQGLLREHAAESESVTALASSIACSSVMLIGPDGLSACSDPVGQFPLFTAQDRDRVLVGSRASALAAEIGDTVDLVVLAARIACPDTPDLFATRTAFQRVRRISEGTVFRADDRGVQQTEHRRIRTESAITLADAAEQLRHHLSVAVSARLSIANRVSSDFSGGFDSTSLAFLAAAETPVVALTSCRAGVPSDDVKRARNFARLNAGLAHHLVATPADHLPFQDLVAAADEPHPTPMFLGPLRARLGAARDLGADLHLVGEGGDVLLGAPPAYLADLARTRDLATLWRHCMAWARLRASSPLRLFRRAMVLGATSRRRALLTLARELQRGMPTGATSWEDDWVCYWRRPPADWLAPGARRRLTAELHALADQDDGHDDIGDRVTMSWLRGQALTQRAVRDAGREFGIDVHAPFLDADVARACLSLAAHRRVDPAVHKPLLRRALSGLVPKAVLAHPAKGDYSRESHHGLRHAAPALRRLLAESAAADCGLIEPGPVLAALDNAVQGLPTRWDALSQVIAVELWLRDTQGKVGSA